MSTSQSIRHPVDQPDGRRGPEDGGPGGRDGGGSVVVAGPEVSMGRAYGP
ncbi:hypothetical protein [Streptacidiphilus sp. EB129]